MRKNEKYRMDKPEQQTEDAPHETSPRICSTESSLLVLQHQDQGMDDCKCNTNL